MPDLMHNSFTFAGTSSASFGLKVERIPNANRPERKFERYSVPGRNGDIFVPQDAWENVEQSYAVWGGRSKGDAVDLGYELAEWLFSPEGYQRLEDTYDTRHYRKAMFVGPYDFENFMLRQGRTELTFDCDPRRFLVSGENARGYSATGTITNPTAFIARPVITVHGSGNGTIECGGNTLTIVGIYDGMVIDCERQDAYSGSTNLNNLISGVFPVIPGGTQTITITGGITSISVVPNWWTL